MTYYSINFLWKQNGVGGSSSEHILADVHLENHPLTGDRGKSLPRARWVAEESNPFMPETPGKHLELALHYKTQVPF